MHGAINGQRMCASESMLVKDVAGPVHVIPKLEETAPMNAYFKPLPREVMAIKLTWTASRFHPDGHMYYAEQSAAVGDTLEHRQFGEVKLEGIGSVAGSMKVSIDGMGTDSMEVQSRDCIFRGATVKVCAHSLASHFLQMHSNSDGTGWFCSGPSHSSRSHRLCYSHGHRLQSRREVLADARRLQWVLSGLSCIQGDQRDQETWAPTRFEGQGLFSHTS